VRFRTVGGEAPALSPAALATLAAVTHAFLLAQRVKRQRFEVNYRGVELEALYDVGLAIASTLNLEELSEEVLLRAVSLLDARRGALYLTEEQELVLNRTFGGEAHERVAASSPEVDALLRGETPREQHIMPGARHLLAVSIETDQGRQGLLVVGDKESRQGVGPFGQADRRSLALFANQAAIAIQNAFLHREALEKQRLEREAELAAEIQRRLLPRTAPALAGYEISGWYRPARHVGGDYYDFVQLPDGRLAFVVADVTGKGMPAALTVSTLHSALRLLLERQPLDTELVAGLNRHLCAASSSNRFVTFFLAALEPADGALPYVNAGHNPALIVQRDGGVTRLGASGMPLGLFEAADYSFGEARLGPGELLVAYSDGITECTSPEEEEFELERLERLVQAHRDEPLPAIVDAVDQAVLDFAGDAAQGDDQTLVLVRRAP
jgi:sigma-B regulation protein RsbU (phosphoserine phosphatase)